MPRVFLSYSRTELPQVRTLTHHLRTGGYDCWFDQELSGGQRWWNEVLRQIAECDVFLPVISERFMQSTACRAELDYAEALGKPLLPVMVEQVSPRFLGPRLGQVQAVDYRDPTVDAALRLMASLRALPPAPPAPHPPPQPPPVPVSYLDTFKEWVETPRVLQRSDQIQLLADLKDRLGGEDAPDIYRLLHAFRARPDLIVAIREEIDALLSRQPPPRVAVPSPASARPRTGATVARVVVGCAATIVGVFVLLVVAGVCVSMNQRSATGTVRTCLTFVGGWCQVTGLPAGSRCQCSYGGLLYEGQVQ